MTPWDAAKAGIQMVYLMEEFDAETTQEIYSIHADNHGGHIGIVSSMYEHASTIVYLLNQQNTQDFPGVFEYEVTEELGRWLFNNPEHFSTGSVSNEFYRYAKGQIQSWFTPAPVSEDTTTEESITMKVSDLITQLQRLDPTMDVLTRGSEPTKMVDAIEVRVVKTPRRTAVFIGKPKPV